MAAVGRNQPTPDMIVDGHSAFPIAAVFGKSSQHRVRLSVRANQERAINAGSTELVTFLLP